MTKSQTNIIERIKSKFHNVEIDTTHSDYFISAHFDNGKEHAMLKTSYFVFIGPRGKVTWKGAWGLMTDKPAERVNASLAAYELGLPMSRNIEI